MQDLTEQNTPLNAPLQGGEARGLGGDNPGEVIRAHVEDVARSMTHQRDYPGPRVKDGVSPIATIGLAAVSIREKALRMACDIAQQGQSADQVIATAAKFEAFMLSGLTPA